MLHAWQEASSIDFGHDDFVADLGLAAVHDEEGTADQQWDEEDLTDEMHEHEHSVFVDVMHNDGSMGHEWWMLELTKN